MREVMPELTRWWEAGATVGMGTVVAIRGASPHEPGASMVVGPSGEVVGSVSGGCAVAVATVLEHPNAAVVGRRLVVRPQQPRTPVPPELPTAGGRRVAGGNDRRFPGG